MNRAPRKAAERLAEPSHRPGGSAGIRYLTILGILCGLPTVLSEAPWWSGIALAVLLYAGCYAPAVGALQPRGSYPNIWLSWVYTVLGATALGILTQWSRRLGAPLVIVPAVAQVLGLVVLGSRRSFCLPVSGPQMARSQGDAWAAAVLVALMLAVPTGLAVLSGAGAAPPFVADSDTGYFLGQVHALRASSSAVIPDPGFLGSVVQGHVGIHELAALVSRWTRIPAHTAFSSVVIPLVAIAFVSALIMLIRALAGNSLPLSLALAFFFVMPWTPRLLVPLASLASLTSRGEWTDLLQRLGQWPGPFFPNYHFHSTSQIGMFLTIVVLVALAKGLGPFRSQIPSPWRIVAYVAAVMPAYKSSHYVAVGLGLGALSLYVASRQRQFALLVASVSGLFFAITILLVGPPQADFRVEPELFFHARRLTESLAFFGPFSGLGLVWHILGYAVFFAPAWLGSRLGEQNDQIGGWRPKTIEIGLACFAALPVLWANLFAVRKPPTFSWPGELNTLQVIDFVPYVLVLLALRWTAHVWDRQSCFGRKVVVITVFLLAAPTLSSRAVDFGAFWKPELNRCFEDTRLLVEALSAIPVEGTVVGTNALTQACDDTQNLNNAGMFGHQMYASALRFKETPETPARRALQLRLSDSRWLPRLLEAFREEEWTHILLDRLQPHPTQVPLPVLFENRRYKVLRL